MKLKAYLAAQKIPVAEFATRIGVHPQAVYRYINGERVPRPAILRRIRDETEGVITPDSFFDLQAAA